MLYSSNDYNSNKLLKLALNDFDKAISKSWYVNLEVYYKRGITLTYLNEYEKAYQNYEKVLKIDSNNFVANYSLGIICMDFEEWKNAIKFFDKLIHTYKNADIYYQRGECYLQLENIRKSKGDFEKAIELKHKESVRIRSMLNELYKKL